MVPWQISRFIKFHERHISKMMIVTVRIHRRFFLLQAQKQSPLFGPPTGLGARKQSITNSPVMSKRGVRGTLIRTRTDTAKIIHQHPTDNGNG